MLSKKRNDNLDNAKWILTLMMVMYHIQYTGKGDSQCSFMFIKNLGDCAVPAFSMISGFYFWRNVKEFSNLKQKYISRVKTILVPYLLWNLLHSIFLWIANGDGTDLDIWHNLILWKSSPHFWYLFMLMFWTVLAPVLFWVYKQKHGLIVLVLISISYVIYKGDTILHSRFIYMIYVWAGYAGFHHQDICEKVFVHTEKKRIIYATMAFIAYIIIYCLYYERNPGMRFQVWLYMLRAVFLLIVLLNLPLERVGLRCKFKYSFWLFAVHYWLDVYIGGAVAKKLLNPHLYQTCTWVIVVSVGLTTGVLLNKMTPVVFQVLTGDRGMDKK